MDKVERCLGLLPLAGMSVPTGTKLPSPASDLVTAFPQHLNLQKVSVSPTMDNSRKMHARRMHFCPGNMLLSSNSQHHSWVLGLWSSGVRPRASLFDTICLVPKHPRPAHSLDTFTLSSDIFLTMEHGSDSWNQQYCGKSFSVFLRSFSYSHLSSIK